MTTRAVQGVEGRNRDIRGDEEGFSATVAWRDHRSTPEKNRFVASDFGRRLETTHPKMLCPWNSLRDEYSALIRAKMQIS
jgi:hypothetical protein